MSDNPPCITDRAYFPTLQDINNHVTKAKSALQLSKLDQQNFNLKIQERKNEIQMLIITSAHLEAHRMMKTMGNKPIHNHSCGYIKRNGKGISSHAMGTI